MNRQVSFSFSLLLAACSGLILLPGCRTADQGEPQPGGHLVRLVVVDDPPLAAAIERLRGEWTGLWGSDFQLEQISLARLAAGDAIDADAILCPSHQLGPLSETNGLVPVPQNLLRGNEAGTQGQSAKWSEIFELIRVREAVWGSKILAVPFGSPLLVCYYRADLLEKLGRDPPQSWPEYREVAELLTRASMTSGKPPGGGPAWYGAIEPLGPGWAGQVLLARAAAYAAHPENYSALFNLTTMDPLIDGPPFVRALEELVAVAASGPAEQLSYDPAAVRKAFWAGTCGLALSWPTAADNEPTGSEHPHSVGFAELPGAVDVYNFRDRQWEARPAESDPHVALLGIAGRIGVVTRRAAWPEETFELLFWLSGQQWPEVSPASSATTLFRRSQVPSAESWVEKQVSAAAASQYAALTQKTLGRHRGMFSPRIPGREEYLTALDEAVRQAVRGEKTPAESLAQAAARWQEITDRLGRKQQGDAYYRSLGLD